MGLVNTCVYVVFQTSSCAPGLQGSFPNGQSSCCHHLLSSYYILALVIRWKADAQNPLLTSGGCWQFSREGPSKQYTLTTSKMSQNKVIQPMYNGTWDRNSPRPKEEEPENSGRRGGSETLEAQWENTIVSKR